MKNRSWGLIVIVALVAGLLLAAGIQAASAPAEIMMNSYEHKRKLIPFTHEKHAVDYKIGCGECHHDDKGKPLSDLKDGDPVQKCFECHNKPGELKGKKARGLSKAEKLAYHANAVHENCVTCHKKHNKENKTKAAPQKCVDCHPKK